MIIPSVSIIQTYIRGMPMRNFTGLRISQIDSYVNNSANLPLKKNVKYIEISIFPMAYYIHYSLFLFAVKYFVMIYFALS